MSASRLRRELPIDVAEEILVQSRVKDLVRYKAVCRSWFDLIGSQRFINKHLLLLHQSSSKNKIVTTTRKIAHVEGVVASLSLPDRYDEAPQVYVPPWTEGVTIVGSCNGLLCLVSDTYRTRVCLWNPSTREHRIAPWVPDQYNADAFALGFGYDVTTGDYKVVRITSTAKFHYHNYRHKHIEFFIQVWSTSTRRWREINSTVLFKLLMHKRVGQTRVGHFIHHQSGIFVRGKLYWLVYQHYPGEDTVLISFDVGDETFRTIEILPDTNADLFRTTSAALFDFMGSLAMPISPISRVYSIMVLGDDEKTWICKLTIGPFQSALTAFPDRVFVDGKFLLRADKKYFLYDPLSGEEKELLGAESPGWYSYGIGHPCWSFVESLVSVRSARNLELDLSFDSCPVS